MDLGLSGRRRRIALVANAVLVAVVAGVVFYAVRADGYRAHEARLNDGGIWVTNGQHGFYGRINKPIGQLDGVVFGKIDASLDIVQDGAAVVGANLSAGLIAPIDPAEVRHPEGGEVGVPGGAQVQLAGGTLAVLDPQSGDLWAQRVDPASGMTGVAALDSQAPALAEAGGTAALAVTRAGTILVASAEEGRLTRIEPDAGGFAKATEEDLPDTGDAPTLTAVGETPVLLDAATGRLTVIDGGTTDLAEGAVLQQPGPDVGAVLVGTPTSLVSVDLGSGEATTLANDVSGGPAAPVRLGACSYGAWAGSAGAVATACDGDDPGVAALGSRSSDLVFRTNRGEIVLNDRENGAVWNIDSDEPTRIDNWNAFRTRIDPDQKDEENEEEDQGDRRPPRAKPDDLGARPGRTTVLHPLDNDSAPDGRLLSVRSVQDISNPDAEVTISPDGQTVQIRLPDDAAGTTTFEYYIDDGRQDVSAHATVSVATRTATANADPHLRHGFEPRIWTVPAGGVLDVPVLPDWRDKEDGDPLSLDFARAVGGETSGAVARTTAHGRVRFTAPAQGGLVTVEYGVTDGIGDPVDDELAIRVQDPRDRRAVAGVAEPDVVSGEAGQPITIRPLGNDLPGSDPVTPDATLELAGRLAETGGASVRTDLVDGTITFRSDIARTYFLDYEAAYGNAPLAPGKIRVDVRPSAKPPPGPVAMPDTLTVYGQSAALVDVLANDVDPAGAMLVVQSAAADSPSQLDVAVVDGRWLRIAPRQGALRPNPHVVSYTISNGTRVDTSGEVVVSQRTAPPDNTPVTEVDRVTVRAGAGVTVPVLDNDFSPSGDALSLVGHVAEERSGRLTVQRLGTDPVPTGEAFVSGRQVRYVAPPDLAEAERFTVRYVAANGSGDSAPGKLEISVVPLDAPNHPPVPPVLEGRTVSGDTLHLRLPGAGVDPDGDAVTLIGIDSAPQLGRIVRFGANSLHYQAYPGSAGTDEFDYRVTDSFGAVASGTVRVAIVPPAQPQPPLAVDDTITVEPGRTAEVDVLANDLIAAGDRVLVELVDAPDGVTLDSDTGPMRLEAPDRVDGRNLEAVYRITNGLDTSQALVTLRTAEPYNNPPVVFDQFGEAEEGDTVSVDVLEGAYDPDGPVDDLRVTDVFAPAGVEAVREGSRVTVTRGPQPIVVPFRVEDGDGGAATASLYVPATGAGLPYVRPEGVIRLDPGETVKERLSDYVVNPGGGDVQFTLKERMWASPAGSVNAQITDETGFEVTAADGYAGPGAVVFEVTTGSSLDDPDGIRAVLSVPVQVGEETPILRCPTEAIEIGQGESVDLDIASLCHVWTADPAAADGLSFDADWSRSSDGLAIIEPSGPVIEVAADGGARPGSIGVLQLTSGGSVPGELAVRVVRTDPPRLSPIRIADMKAGESRTVDLARYLQPGISNPEPTVVEVSQLTGLDVQIAKEGASAVTITTGERVDGRAEFRVVMSDVSATDRPERQAEGRIVLDILDVPDRPLAPVPGTAIRDSEVQLAWRAPAANGAPIDRYELRASNGDVRRCGSTSCDFPGLTNGKPYTFTVRAHNAVGWSEWSARSAKATPDAPPGRVGPIEMVSRGDRTITLRWTKPTTKTSAIERYFVTWQGGSAVVTTPRVTATGLDNNVAYTFTVEAQNARFTGEPRTSAPFQSIGAPGTPRAPTVTPTDPASDTTAVIVDWDPVDPNGPAPVVYTVFRNGAPICTTQASECTNAGVVYDGTRYTYAVKAANNGGKGDSRSVTGPGTDWSAIGQPEAWGTWQVAPTGQNNQAHATFTVPKSRGAQSNVTIFVDGAAVLTFQGTGGQDRPFPVPDNDRAHSVQLRVCNEDPTRCSTSTVQSVQTYGPFATGHILSIDGQVSGTQVRWVVTVDSNGDPAQVRVNGPHTDQSFSASTVNVQTFTTNWVDIGPENTETVTVTLSDNSPGRAGVSRTATSPQTAGPQVSVSRGSKCNDGNSLPDCNTGGSGTPCVHVSCGFIVITTANFSSGSATCDIYDSVDGQWTTKTVETNRSVETRAYFGFPDREIWAICNGERSPNYNWPND